MPWAAVAPANESLVAIAATGLPLRPAANFVDVAADDATRRPGRTRQSDQAVPRVLQQVLGTWVFRRPEVATRGAQWKIGSGKLSLPIWGTRRALGLPGGWHHMMVRPNPVQPRLDPPPRHRAVFRVGQSCQRQLPVSPELSASANRVCSLGIAGRAGRIFSKFPCPRAPLGLIRSAPRPVPEWLPSRKLRKR